MLNPGELSQRITRLVLYAFGDAHLGDDKTVAKMGHPKLVDEFGVSSGEGNGVVAGGEIGGDIPNQGTAWGADEGEEEVGAGRGLC